MTVSRLRVLLPALGVMVALALAVPALPAAAHARLLGSEPAAGATLPTAPSELRLTFSEAIEPDFAQVQVTSPSAARLDAGAAAVDGVTVTVALQPSTETGDHAVAFRVISSDGHPIDASFTYRVSPSIGAPSAPPTVSAPPTATASAPPTATGSPSPSTAPLPVTASPGGGLPIGSAGAALAGAAGLGGVAYLLVRRRSATGGAGDDPLPPPR